MRESQLLSGLESPLFAKRKNTLIRDRGVTDLGPVDIRLVQRNSGAVHVLLVQRDMPQDTPALAVSMDILVYPAEDFIAKASQYMRVLPESFHKPMPEPEATEPASTENLGTVAAFQISRLKNHPQGLEMVWSSTDNPTAVRALVTSAQVKDFLIRIVDALKDMDEEERESRLVKLEGWGTPRKVNLDKGLRFRLGVVDSHASIEEFLRLPGSGDHGVEFLRG